MDVTVITVTWNSAKYIADQMRSVIFGCEGLTWEQIVVDNASSDETVQVVESICPLFTKEGVGGGYKIIKNPRNFGFAGGYNQAVKKAEGRYFLYLNPDMKILEPIAPLVKYLDDHPNVGIASAKLVEDNGEINLEATPRRFPRWSEALIIFFKLPHIFPKILDRYLYRDTNFSKIVEPTEVDSVRGSFMLIRREIVEKLGFAFDPRYFLWWEDVDLCREVKRLGYKIVWHPGVRCVDRVGQSFRVRNVVWKQWNFFKGAVKYFVKWGILN